MNTQPPPSGDHKNMTLCKQKCPEGELEVCLYLCLYVYVLIDLSKWFIQLLLAHRLVGTILYLLKIQYYT